MCILEYISRAVAIKVAVNHKSRKNVAHLMHCIFPMQFHIRILQCMLFHVIERLFYDQYRRFYSHTRLQYKETAPFMKHARFSPCVNSRNAPTTIAYKYSLIQFHKTISRAKSHALASLQRINCEIDAQKFVEFI